MDQLFYGLMFFLIISFFIINISKPVVYEESWLQRYNEYVVTHKYEKNMLLPNQMILRKDTLKVNLFAEDIIFNKFSVGDTVFIKK